MIEILSIQLKNFFLILYDYYRKNLYLYKKIYCIKKGKKGQFKILLID